MGTYRVHCLFALYRSTFTVKMAAPCGDMPDRESGYTLQEKELLDDHSKACNAFRIPLKERTSLKWTSKDFEIMNPPKGKCPSNREGDQKAIIKRIFMSSLECVRNY